MERDGCTKVKVVWVEGAQAHSVVATPKGEIDGFLEFLLPDGRFIRLQKTMVVKLEEVLR